MSSATLWYWLEECRQTMHIELASFDLNIQHDRLRAVVCMFNVYRVLSSLAPAIPSITMRLGASDVRYNSQGEVARTVTFFSGKCIIFPNQLLVFCSLVMS